MKRQARQKLADLRGLLSRQATEGRQVLRHLLDDPIRFTPFAEGMRRGYRFEGYAAIVGLLMGTVDVRGLASPHGTEAGLQMERLSFLGEFEVRRAA